MLGWAEKASWRRKRTLALGFERTPKQRKWKPTKQRRGDRGRARPRPEAMLRLVAGPVEGVQRRPSETVPHSAEDVCSRSCDARHVSLTWVAACHSGESKTTGTHLARGS